MDGFETKSSVATILKFILKFNLCCVLREVAEREEEIYVIFQPRKTEELY